MKDIELNEIDISEQDDNKRHVVCVLDASSYVGFRVLEGLLDKGYTVHAGIQQQYGDGLEPVDAVKMMREIEKTLDERLKVFVVDVLDYHSICVALKGCEALFCSLDCYQGYEEKTVEMEVRGAINVVEACAQAGTVDKVVFSSSLAAAIWRENISSQLDVDERSWSDPNFCRKLKLWYALAKTLSEQAAWALAMDRRLNMVSINYGLVLGPNIVQQNPLLTLSYLKGAPEMYENGVLATVGLEFLVDVHIRALEDHSTCGRYLCFDKVVNTEQEAVKLAKSLSPLIPLPPREQEAVKLAKSLSPLIPLPPRYECQGSEASAERLRNTKLSKLVEGTAY